MHDEDVVIGFGRVVSDRATYSMAFDVIIDENYRGKGIGRTLMNLITSQRDRLSVRPGRSNTLTDACFAGQHLIS